MNTWPGYDGWVSRDYGGKGKAVSVSKAQLGEFCYWVFLHRGHIHSASAMADCPRAYVQFAISLPPGRKEKFEQDSGFALEKPPTIKLA